MAGELQLALIIFVRKFCKRDSRGSSIRIVQVSLLGSLLVESIMGESCCERRGSSSTYSPELGCSPSKNLSVLNSFTLSLNVMSLYYGL